MGYYSNFNVSVRSEEKFSVNNFLKALGECTGYYITDYSEYSVQDMQNSFDFDIFEKKFYSYREEFSSLSKKFPKLKIFVSRQGEDAIDFEENLFENGDYKTKELQAILPKWENKEIDNVFSLSRPVI